jgi:arylsulfatase A
LKTLATILTTLLLAPPSALNAADQPAAKPNIILIMADDLGYAGLGCYGQKLILTPEIDRMAAAGMRFTDFYAANTVCVPSRVGMLLGLHPGHAPIRDNFLPHLPDFSGYMKEYPAGLWPPKLPTLGQIIKAAGYKTAQFGKLEAGIPLSKGGMTAHGWDYWFGFRGTGDAFQYYPLQLWKNDELVRFEENLPAGIRRPGIVGDRGVYSQDLFLGEVLQFIKSNKHNPFFVYFPTQIPHGRAPADGDQMQLPDIGPYADREWSHLEKLYAAAVTRLDSHVGRIIQELKDQGIDERTLILFTSDNGDENSYYEYTKRFGATGPLKGKKRFLYEGGIRVPMIARWPGRIAPGQTCRTPAASWDIMPTLAELAGTAKPAHTDGISMVPMLLGHPEKQQAREYLYWEFHMGKQQAVRMGRWKGVRFGGTKEPIELHDLDADVGEARNLAEAHPDIVARISAIMEEARGGSEYNKFWPLPERRQNQIKMDRMIFDQLENGIR